MPALNFSKQFAAAVASGKKTQTIRRDRKDRPIVAGDKLFLFTGMRGEGGVKATRLGTVVCKCIKGFSITEHDIWISGRYCSDNRCLTLARDDGFDTVDDFRAWFRKLYGLPFHGQLIVWEKMQ